MPLQLTARRLLLLLVVWSTVAIVPLPAALTESERPNIVVILCDDLGYGDLECYGNPRIKTPHLNQLATGGIRFTDFYSAAPVCSPSRVGLLTGRSPNRAGVYDWIPSKSEVHLRAGETTLAQLLQQAGYATCLSGKWHCNGKFNTADQPQPDAAGFDHWFATQNNAAPSHDTPTNFVRNGENVGPIEGFSCQIVVDEALDWLDQVRTRDAEQRFFMFLAFHEPHEPVASPPEMVEEYLPISANRDEAEYLANVANVDAAVGKLMAGLRQHELADNTLVIFTSDNGPETLMRYARANRSYGTPAPLRGMKLWTTEAGFRVPGIAHWPNGIRAGQVSEEPVSSLDFLPTFSALAGTAPPASLNLDGANALPALRGGSVDRDKPLLWVYYNAINERRVAMRSGHWKVLARMDLPKFKSVETGNEAGVRAATLSDWQLFDLRNDPAEVQDLAAAQPATLEKLKVELETAYRELIADSPAWES